MKQMYKALAVAACAGIIGGANAQARINIGAPLAQTGPYAFVGVSMMKGVTYGVEEINRKGGINGARINLILEDSASDKAQTVTLVNRMITRDQVVAIIGPATTIEATAVVALVNEKEVPLLTNSAALAVRNAGKWSFNVASAPNDIMTRLAKYGTDNMKVKRVAMVAARENETFQTWKNLVRDQWKSQGVEIVSDDTLAASDSDFTALATKLADAKVDTVGLFVPPEQSANLIIQARQAGLSNKVRVVASPGSATQSYIQAGGATTEGTVLVADYYPETPTEINKSFVAGFRAKYGQPPDNYAAMGYSTVQILEKAMRESGTTRAKVRDGVEKIAAMPTVLGDGKFTMATGRAPVYGAAILQVKGGKFVLAD